MSIQMDTFNHLDLMVNINTVKIPFMNNLLNTVKTLLVKQTRSKAMLCLNVDYAIYTFHLDILT